MVPDEMLSRHAAIRSQQRGIPRAAVELVLAEGDLVESAGEGCERITLSRQAMDLLALRGVNRKVLDRSRGVALVYSCRTAQIVTVQHAIRPFRYRRHVALATPAGVRTANRDPRSQSAPYVHTGRQRSIVAHDRLQ